MSESFRSYSNDDIGASLSLLDENCLEQKICVAKRSTQERHWDLKIDLGVLTRVPNR